MTTFADFQAYYLRKVWRTGDADLTQDLPKLIREAEARIARDFRDNFMVKSYNTVLSAGRVVPLPGDFKEMMSISHNGTKFAEAVTFPQLVLSQADRDGEFRGPYYAIMGDSLYFRGTATAEAPVNIVMTYFADIVPYHTEPAIPFYDLHPDFYTAALNIQVYDYLREFEMKQQNENDYNNLLDGMIRQSNYARYPSGQISMPMPR